MNGRDRKNMKSHSLLSAAVKIAAVGIALAVRTASGAHGAAADAHAAEPAERAEASADAEASKAIHGISLGDYRIRSYYQVAAQKSTVSFSLYATVKDEHYAGMQRLVEEHRQKLRDQIILATRLAPLSVFQEPDLITFRRRLLVRLRRVIPDFTIEDLYLSEFDLVIKAL
jgi:hypothetical protein